MKEIIIDYRFRGPPRSGNGGYVCGMLAKTLDDVVEVTLLKPVPLNVSLKITRSDDGGATLARGEIILASAKQTNLRLDGLAAASFAQADYASRATPFVEDNRDASGCFVCGPGRGAKVTACASLPGPFRIERVTALFTRLLGCPRGTWQTMTVW